jgi:hypothetical protein
VVASANTISDPLARGWSGIDALIPSTVGGSDIDALIPWASRRQAPVSNMSTETDILRMGLFSIYVSRRKRPCLPSPADRPPSGSNWIHEIKHDGYRLMARRDSVDIRLITRRGNDWSERFPLVVEAVNHLKARSCLIGGEGWFSRKGAHLQTVGFGASFDLLCLIERYYQLRSTKMELSASPNKIIRLSIELLRKRLAADRASFNEPCLPSPADKPPSGDNCFPRIKHDGFRLMARRDPVGTRPDHPPGQRDWTLSAGGRGGEPPQGTVVLDRRGLSFPAKASRSPVRLLTCPTRSFCSPVKTLT